MYVETGDIPFKNIHFQPTLLTFSNFQPTLLLCQKCSIFQPTLMQYKQNDVLSFTQHPRFFLKSMIARIVAFSLHATNILK